MNPIASGRQPRGIRWLAAALTRANGRRPWKEAAGARGLFGAAKAAASRRTPNLYLRLVRVAEIGENAAAIRLIAVLRQMNYNATYGMPESPGADLSNLT